MFIKSLKGSPAISFFFENYSLRFFGTKMAFWGDGMGHVESETERFRSDAPYLAETKAVGRPSRPKLVNDTPGRL